MRWYKHYRFNEKSFNRFTRIIIPYMKFRTLVIWAVGIGVVVGFAMGSLFLIILSALIKYAINSLGV